MNLADQPIRSYPKSQQLSSKRTKPTQKQMGAISPKVRAEVRLRSGGICEVRVRCNGARAYEQAHLKGRNTITHKTTADDLRDSCVSCHRHLDNKADGVRLKRQLRSE